MRGLAHTGVFIHLKFSGGIKNELLVAMIAALSMTACQKAEEVDAPAMEQGKEAAGAAADVAGANKVQEVADKAKAAAQK